MATLQIVINPIDGTKRRGRKPLLQSSEKLTATVEATHIARLEIYALREPRMSVSEAVRRAIELLTADITPDQVAQYMARETK